MLNPPTRATGRGFVAADGQGKRTYSRLYDASTPALAIAMLEALNGQTAARLVKCPDCAALPWQFCAERKTPAQHISRQRVGMREARALLHICRSIDAASEVCLRSTVKHPAPARLCLSCKRDISGRRGPAKYCETCASAIRSEAAAAYSARYRQRSNPLERHTS